MAVKKQVYRPPCPHNANPKCRRKGTAKPHPCPFKVDVNNDNETLCHCCPDCQHACAREI